MAYDWEAHRQKCYDLYIEEGMSLEDIMIHMRVHYDFAPSKRAFQERFRRWNFPPKRPTARQNDHLIQRIRELWERNLPQKTMLQTLHDEGFTIGMRQLMRLRAHHRWRMRGPGTGGKENGEPEKDDNDGGDDDSDSTDSSDHEEEAEKQEEKSETKSEEKPAKDVLATKTERLHRRQAESAERLAARKRRRHTRTWAGLPADPPGPPRFPSETTVDESKAMLGLVGTAPETMALYLEIRRQFQAICTEAGVMKKTEAGSAAWEVLKDRLVQAVPHLAAVLADGDASGDTNCNTRLALDVLCTDVAKRMRGGGRKSMRLSEAKNALGINPDQSRDIRAALYAILRDDHFTSKMEAGPEHWRMLQRRWFDRCSVLRTIVGTPPGDRDGDRSNRPLGDDPQYAEKKKAVETLARDVVKRWRDGQTQRQRHGKKGSGAVDETQLGEEGVVKGAPPTPNTALIPPLIHITTPATPTASDLDEDTIAGDIDDMADMTDMNDMGDGSDVKDNTGLLDGSPKRPARKRKAGNDRDGRDSPATRRKSVHGNTSGNSGIDSAAMAMQDTAARRYSLSQPVPMASMSPLAVLDRSAAEQLSPVQPHSQQSLSQQPLPPTPLTSFSVPHQNGGPHDGHQQQHASPGQLQQASPGKQHASPGQVQHASPGQVQQHSPGLMQHVSPGQLHISAASPLPMTPMLGQQMDLGLDAAQLGVGDAGLDPSLAMQHLQMSTMMQPTSDEPFHPQLSMPSAMGPAVFVPGSQQQQQHQHQQQHEQHSHHQEQRHHHQQQLQQPLPASPAIAVYFRLHPASACPGATPLWIDMLSVSASLMELQTVATLRYPGAVCISVQGLVVNRTAAFRANLRAGGSSRGDGSVAYGSQGSPQTETNDGVNGANGGHTGGTAVPIQINTDEQLQAFLRSMLPDESPTFIVQLVQLLYDGRASL